MGLRVIIIEQGRLQAMKVRVHLQSIVCLIGGLVLLGDLVGAQMSEATTYYVATNGSDSNPGTEAHPFLTLRRGVRDLKPGDTLYVKNGTYTSWGYTNIPSGTSWANPVTIAAYPGHSPVIVKATQDAHTLNFINSRYTVLDGFFINGTNASNGIKITNASSGRIASHIRIQNSEIAHARADGIFTTPGSDGNEFIHLQVHDNGTNDFNHGIYIKSSDNIVEDCEIHDNTGWGVHVYGGSNTRIDNNIVRNNEIYNNGRSGTRGSGIILSSGSGNQAYNNVIWGNIGGISVNYRASNTYVSDNIIHDNTRFGIFIGTGSSHAFIGSNNIYNNHGPAIIDYGVLTER
jgi:parallel beta-helix repeat protein